MLPFPQLCLPEAPQQATVTSVPTSEDCHDEWSTWRMQGLVYGEDLRHVFFHIGLGVFVREMSQKALARYSHC